MLRSTSLSFCAVAFLLFTTACADATRKQPAVKYDRVDSGADTGMADATVRDVALLNDGSGFGDNGAANPGSGDSGHEDQGVVDARSFDTGLVDLGVVDVGFVDTWAGPEGDTGGHDSGAGDAGLFDAGDESDSGSSPVDTGTDDTGVGPVADTGADLGSDASSSDLGLPDVSGTDSGLSDLGSHEAGTDTGSGQGLVCPVADLGQFYGACDPIHDTGCSGSEACLIAVQLIGPDVVISSVCSDGSNHVLKEGEPCLNTNDRCEPGTYCINYIGVCSKLCWMDTGEGCASDQICRRVSSDWNLVGYCTDSCD